MYCWKHCFQLHTGPASLPSLCIAIPAQLTLLAHKEAPYAATYGPAVALYPLFNPGWHNWHLCKYIIDMSLILFA